MISSLKARSELDKLACLSEHVANKFDMVELELPGCAFLGLRV